MKKSGYKAGFRENLFVAGCLVFCICRLFLFISAYPFFNNRDELLHYDMVVWSSGFHLENKMHGFNPKSIREMALYGSPEYLHVRGEYPGGKYPEPVYRLPRASQDREVKKASPAWVNLLNRYSLRPPLYYFLASAWEKAGIMLGLQGGSLLYWLRYLNIPVYLAFMLAGIYFARWLPGRDPLFRLGIPFLLAIFPSDVFYGINADVPSALLLGGAFIMLAESLMNHRRGYLFHALLGLAVAASIFAKFTSIPLVAGAAALLAPDLREKWKRRGGSGKLVLAGTVALLPVALWLARNAALTGDLTGTAGETRSEGFSLKPLAGWLSHPVFSVRGAGYFAAEVVKNFWRGGLCWGREAIAGPSADILYVLSTFVFLGFAGLALFRDKPVERKERIIARVGIGSISAGVIFLFMFSIVFNFGTGYEPSRTHPFLIEGRYLLGALLPFTYLFLKGLGTLAGLIRPGRGGQTAALALLFIGGTLAAMAQVIDALPVFHSAYNWFHLP